MGSLCHLPCTCSWARGESRHRSANAAHRESWHSISHSTAEMQTCKSRYISNPQPLWSAGTQAGRHCDTCKSSWSCACPLAAVKEGTKGICDSWEAGRCVPAGLREQLLLNFTGDIIYLQYSTTAHSCPHTESHQQAHLSPCLCCWSLFLPSGLLETAAGISFATGLPSFTSFHQLFISPHLPLALELCLHPTHPFTFLHLSPPWLHWWWQMAISHTFVFTLPCSHKLLLLP